MSTIEILFDSCRGIHIPEVFAAECKNWQGISEVEFLVLELGPSCGEFDNVAYWDTWNDVLNNAYYVDKQGTKWTLYQDGDLFAVSEHHVFEGEE